MTDRRRERARRAALATGAPAPEAIGRRSTYWVTRGSEAGRTDDHARVWVREPERRTLGDMVYWYSERENGAGAYWATWDLEFCRLRVGTIPDDDRMCLRVDGEGLWYPGAAA